MCPALRRVIVLGAFAILGLGCGSPKSQPSAPLSPSDEKRIRMMDESP